MTRGIGPRRAPAPTCKVAQKIRFDDEAAARGAAIARVRRDGNAEPLAVYRCPHCGGWHHTSSRGGSNRSRLVPGRGEKPAFTQEKLDRVLDLVRDAKGIALTALFEYPKGDMPAVLAVVQEADREGREALGRLERHELDSPELRAALDTLRPKLRAMEQLVKGKIDFTDPVEEAGE